MGGGAGSVPGLAGVVRDRLCQVAGVEGKNSEVGDEVKEVGSPRPGRTLSVVLQSLDFIFRALRIYWMIYSRK